MLIVNNTVFNTLKFIRSVDVLPQGFVLFF